MKLWLCICLDKRGPRCQDHVEELAIISLVFLKSHDGPQRSPFTAFDCLRLSLNILRLVFRVASVAPLCAPTAWTHI